MNFFSLNSCPGTNRLGRYPPPAWQRSPVESIVAGVARTVIATPTAAASCPGRGRRHRTSTLRLWLIRGAIAVAALAVMVNGAAWELTDSPAAANELVMARSVIDVISGDAAPANDAVVPTRITREPTR